MSESKQTGVCAHCGKTFEQKIHGHKAVFCSKKCANAALNVKRMQERHAARMVEHVCARCGATYLPNSTRGSISKYCNTCMKDVDRERNLAWHARKSAEKAIMVPCNICGKMFRKMNQSTICHDCHVKIAEEGMRRRRSKLIRESRALDTQGCNDSEVDEVMHVALHVPEAKRWKITKDWPSRKLELLRSIYRAQHDL